MKEKFTATMVFNSDKELVQELRNEFDLGEKELMALLIQTALDNKEGLTERVTNFKEALEASKAVIAKQKADEKEKAKLERATLREAKKAEKAAEKEQALVAAKKGKKKA